MTLIDPSPFRRDDPLAGLLDRYLLSGDDEAMDEIVARTRGKLLSVARRIGAPQDAEDAVQTAYFSLIRKRGERLEAPVLPWLLTAVVRIAYRQRAVHQRQHQIARRLSKPPPAASPLAELATADEADRMRAEIARLPARYRDPVVLRLLQGLDTKETAELLGLPEPTVRTRLHRGRALLRSRWPSPVTHGFLFLPWLAVDTGRAATDGVSGFFAGATPPIVLTTIAIAGLFGGGAGYLLRASSDRVEQHRDSDADLIRLQEENTRLLAGRERIERDRRRVESTTGKLVARRKAAADALKAWDGRIGTVTRKHDVAVAAGELTDALSRVDWAVVGENTVELTILIQKELRTRAEAELVSNEFIAKKRARNSRLVKEVAKVWSDLPTHDSGMPHTHPAFMVNAMAAALAHLDMPLRPGQVDRLSKIAADYRVKDAERRKRYDLDTYELTRLREESELKERSLQDARAVLDPAQADALFPKDIAGRVGCDLFSPGLMWLTPGRVHTISFEGREAFVRKLVGGLKEAFEISESEKEDFRRLVSDWVAGVEVLACEPNENLRLHDLHRMARKTEDLLRSIERELPSNEQRAELMRFRTGVIVPCRVDEER